MSIFKNSLIWSALAILIFLPGRIAADASTPLLVSPAWLAGQLHNTKLLIIDTRTADLYAQKHLSGAINIPVDMTFATSGKTYRVGSIQYISQLFSRLGIQYDHHIILYDDGRLIDAARFFWVLEVYGHTRVSLLDGGMPLWLKSNLPNEQIARQRPASQFVPTINQRRITTKLAMQVAIHNPGVRVIDARHAEEYRGEKSSAPRAGHIPNAISIPWDLNIDNAAGLNQIPSLTQLTNNYKPYQRQRIITYCNKGKQSALTYFVLRYLNYDVSLYDGAWPEWASDNTLPIE